MGLIKKGSRKINVDGIIYCWRYPTKPNQNHNDGYPGVIVAVQQLNNKNGSVLAINFDRYHMNGAYFDLDMRKPLLPSEIAVCIRKAIEVGWQSNLCGKQFMLDAEENWFTNLQ